MDKECKILQSIQSNVVINLFDRSTFVGIVRHPGTLIEVVHMTYHPVNMAAYSNAFNKSMIAIYRDSSSHT